MFISHSSYRFPMPEGLGAPGGMYWRALNLSIRLPWFIATFELPDGDSTHLHTVCLWWTEDPLALLAQEPKAKLRSLQCVCPQSDGNLRWLMRDVAKIWRGTEPASQQRELIFEDSEGAHFSTFPPDLGADVFTDRELLLELPQPNQRAKRSGRAGRSRPMTQPAGQGKRGTDSREIT